MDKKMEEFWLEGIRRMPPWKKWRMVDDLIRASRMMAMAGLRMKYPDATEEELKRRLAARVLDRESVIKAYGWDPEEEGY